MKKIKLIFLSLIILKLNYFFAMTDDLSIEWQDLPNEIKVEIIYQYFKIINNSCQNILDYKIARKNFYNAQATCQEIAELYKAFIFSDKFLNSIKDEVQNKGICPLEIAKIYLDNNDYKTVISKIKLNFFAQRELYFLSLYGPTDNLIQALKKSVDVNLPLPSNFSIARVINTLIHKNIITLEVGENILNNLHNLGLQTSLRQRVCDTALSLAILGGNINSIKALIECGANVNHKNFYGTTPLMFVLAIFSAYGPNYSNHLLSLVKMLVKYGAQINSTDKQYMIIRGHLFIHRSNRTNGRTALMLASHYGLTEVVRFLLNNGANVYIKDKDDCSAYTYASLNQQRHIEEILRENIVGKDKCICNIL